MSALDLRAVVKTAVSALVISAAAQAAQVLPPPGPESAVPTAPGGPGLAVQDGDDSLDVLTRGPIHEAFAEQYNADPAGGLIVTKAPPEPIDEIAPETIPEGNNIQWMTGYWGWADEREDFIWISGLWRDVPPGQRWVPGYWNPVEGGYQWVSGFWTGTENEELAYQPEGPPATLEQGPNIDASAENQFWVPGVWTYVDYNYRWRPGYWAPAYDDWVWVPDRWVWTPYGFVFLPGYHDYRLPVRAVAFAPVYFTHVHWWHHHHRPFCPSVVLDCGPLTMHWFVRPNYCHYYFGDFYADTYYTGWGLQPWYTCSFGFGGYGGWRNRHCHYDPLFVFYNGYHRRHHHVDFGDRMHKWHNHYLAHADDRPRWTKRDQDNFDDALRKAGRVRGDGKQNRIGRDFNEFVKNPTERDQKFVRLDERQRERHTKVGKETVQLATLRHDIESDGGKIRGVRGDGKKGGNGNGETIGLQGGNGGEGNSGGNKGDGGRGSRKVRLPTDQGAGDQTVITQDGNREANHKKRRNLPPDGPPGGNSGIVSTDGNDGGSSKNKSGGNNSRRGRGQELTDGSSGQGNSGNNTVTDGNPNGNGDSSRRGRGNSNDNKGGSNGNSSGLRSGDVQVPDNSGGNNNGSSRGRGRTKGSNNGNQDLTPSNGNPFGGSNSGNSGGDGNKGSNRDRTPRRGNSGDGSKGGNNGGNNGAFGGNNPNFKNQPPSGGGNSNGNGNGNGSNGGRSRSRGSFDSNSNSGGNGGSNSGNSGGNNNNQRRKSGGNNNQGSGSGLGNSSNSGGGSFGSGSGGGGSRRNERGSGGNGGNSGSDKKKKKD